MAYEKNILDRLTAATQLADDLRRKYKTAEIKEMFMLRTLDDELGEIGAVKMGKMANFVPEFIPVWIGYEFTVNSQYQDRKS